MLVCLIPQRSGSATTTPGHSSLPQFLVDVLLTHAGVLQCVDEGHPGTWSQAFHDCDERRQVWSFLLLLRRRFIVAGLACASICCTRSEVHQRHVTRGTGFRNAIVAANSDILCRRCCGRSVSSPSSIEEYAYLWSCLET